MKVLKFGGTSVGTVESLSHVKKIVESIEGNAVVVVSALGGLTDKLIATANLAAEGNSEWHSEMDAIISRHMHIIENVISPERKNQVKKAVKDYLDELKRNYEGVELIRSLPSHILDIIVSFGERISSTIVAAMIKNGERHDSLEFIKTEKWFDKNIANRKLTDTLIKEEFKNLMPDEKAIVPGFISRDTETNEITNLGRGGSDYSGALIAAALDAEILEIWTDVDGFMTSDPRIVKDAIVIDHLTFTESMELCTFGAKVIYPPTIYPVFHKNIPIKILNTFNPEAPGTLITDSHHKDDLEVKGVSALKGISLLSFQILKADISEDIYNRALNSLSKNGVSIIPVANPDPYSELNFAVPEKDSIRSIDILAEEFAPEISKGKLGDFERKDKLAAVALVGERMKTKTRLAARIGHSLRRQGINIEAYSPGNSDTTIIFIVHEEKTSETVRSVHSMVYK